MAPGGITTLAQDILRSPTAWPAALASAVSGALAYLFVDAGKLAIIAPGKALAWWSDAITGAFSVGVNRVTSAMVSASSNAWSASLDLGPLQLPYNLLAVLLTFGIIGYGLARWRDD